MTFDIEVYCLRQPDVKQLQSEFGGHHYMRSDTTESFGTGSNRTGFDLHAMRQPRRHQEEFSLESMRRIARDAENAGIAFPPQMLEKFRAEGEQQLQEMIMKYNLQEMNPTPSHVITADATLYAFLQQMPAPHATLPTELQRVFTITHFSRGEPLYLATLSVAHGSGPAWTRHMANHAQIVAERYGGLIYNPQNGLFGIENIEECAERSKTWLSGILDALQAGGLRVGATNAEAPSPKEPDPFSHPPTNLIQ